MRLLRDCEKHKIDSHHNQVHQRFARNTADCLEIVRRPSELGVFIYFEKENTNTRSMDSELFARCSAALRKTSRFPISQNNKWGIKKRFQSGRSSFQARPTVIYCNGTIVPHPEEAAVVKRIFAEILTGRGTHAVAEGLNADGINPARGKWTASAVRGILKMRSMWAMLFFKRPIPMIILSVIINHGEEEVLYKKIIMKRS